MKVAVYSTKSYDRKYLELINAKYGLELEFYDFMLSERTAKMAEHCEAVCIFVNEIGRRQPKSVGKTRRTWGKNYCLTLRRV